MGHKIHSKGASNMKVVIGVFVGGLLLTGIAIMYGRMDAGQIDVSATITNANNTRSAAGEGAESQLEQPTSKQFSGMPNGGLVGTGNAQETPPPPPPVEETSSTTATSTDETTSDDTSNGDEGVSAPTTEDMDNNAEAQNTEGQ